MLFQKNGVVSAFLLREPIDFTDIFPVLPQFARYEIVAEIVTQSQNKQNAAKCSIPRPSKVVKT